MSMKPLSIRKKSEERGKTSLNEFWKLHLFLLPVQQIVWSENLPCYDYLLIAFSRSRIFEKLGMVDGLLQLFYVPLRYYITILEWGMPHGFSR